MTRRPALWLVAVTFGVGGALLYLGWRGLQAPPEEPLDDNWNAVVAVLAGDGVAGVRDSHVSRARFSDPFGVAMAADGSVYVADAGDAQRIRRIAPDGTVSTVAGGERGYLDGPAARARFDTPSGLAIDAAGAVYVADTGNNVIRRIAPDGIVSTLAGDGTAGDRDGPAVAARFNGPIGVAVDSRGWVIVADTYNDRIRAIHPGATVTTLAGSSQGWADGAAGGARFDTPGGVAVDEEFNVYVADTGNGALRTISPAGVVTTIDPVRGDRVFRPLAIAVGADGVLYVADDARVLAVRPGAEGRTLAGSRRGFADGDGRGARFREVQGVAVAEPGRLVVTDAVNALVRLVAAPSRMPLRPPASPWIAPAFDRETFAHLPLLWPFGPLEGPFEITGTLGEARGGPGAERFHAGLDVSGSEGTTVVAVRDGVVARPIAVTAVGGLEEAIDIGPIKYVHLRVGRSSRDEVLDASTFIPSYDPAGRVAAIRVKRGTRFRTGERIGTLNAFNHAHLNIGWTGEEHNPLLFRPVRFEDTVPPRIAPGGVRLFAEDDSPLTSRRRGRLVVAGRVRVVVDAWDQVDGNAARRRLGLYALGYQVLRPDGSAAPGFETPRETLVFDRLAPDDAAARLVFWSGSGIPYFRGGPTRFLYVVTNTFRGGVAATGFWDTGELPPGDYTLRILARDVRGNVALANRDLRVTIADGAAGRADSAG